jgi:hypothetical protein
MSDLPWVVVWDEFSEGESGKGQRLYHGSEDFALMTACYLIGQHHTVQRIEGPRNKTIEREGVERRCKNRPPLQR